MTPIQMWEGYNPVKDPLETYIQKCNVLNDIAETEMYFTAESLKDGKIRVYSKMYAHKDWDTSHPAVLFLSDLSTSSNYVEISEMLVEQGYVVFVVDYAGFMPDVENPTSFPDSLKYASFEEAKHNLKYMGESARQTPWFVWAKIARRAITLMEEQKIIDNEKNVKVYTTKIFVGENAYFEEQDDSSFEIVATVSRNNGGIIEERPSKVKVSVVDFLVDSINLDVDSVDKNNLNVFLGIDKYLNFAFDTTTWEDTTYLDPTIQEAITKLRENVQKFVEQNYFVANDPTGSDSYYIVNYHQGDEDYLSSTSARYKNLLNNLYYVNADGSSVKVLSASGYLNANPYFDFDYSGNGKWSDTVGGKYLKIVGKSTGTQKMRLVFAYLTPDKVKHELTFDFTITIKVYTDEDRPTQITTAEEFVAIQKQNDAQDFILMNDIELSYYVPFDTSKIKTFDGNNKIITIRSFDMSDDQTNSLNLALFSNVTADTILKNITVNYYHNDNIIVDTTTYKTINFAGFAITNNGSIANGHVLAMRTNLSLANPTNDAGINISYTCGNIPSTIQSKIAGFVLNNNGVITNSRVGGESFKKIYSNNVSVGDYALSKFTISGQGDIAGFVYENTGIITSSFANNIALTNNTKTGIETATAGFAVTNQSSVRELMMQ